MPVPLQLFSTLGCHLCEQAEAMLIATLPADAYELEVVEISNSDALMAAYGVRIPVLRRTDTDVEIGWPFLPQDILQLAHSS